MAVPSNLITDVKGIRVGNAADADLASGVTVVLVDRPNVASGTTRGGAPGQRDTAMLAPEMTVESVDAVVLSGGSAFGLDAAGGVMAALRDQGVGLSVGSAVVPIVTQAIVFDLLNGGNKDWGPISPYAELGRNAVAASAAGAFPLGTVGGGHGATTCNLKGGLGSASATTSFGSTVGAIVIVNAVGSAVVGDGPHFWAAPYERDGEFGGRGFPAAILSGDLVMRMKGGAPPSTTIALVATDATLTKAQAKRLAIMADDGMARAIRPSHAPMDGDTVFAVATQQRAPVSPVELAELGQLAADCLARAIARGVYEAVALPFAGALPAWKDRFARGGML